MPSCKGILCGICSIIKEKRNKSDIKGYIIEKKLIGHECIICLDEFNIGETVTLIKCGHMYHTHCLYYWFLTKEVCPLCDEELKIKY